MGTAAECVDAHGLNIQIRDPRTYKYISGHFLCCTWCFTPKHQSPSPVIKIAFLVNASMELASVTKDGLEPSVNTVREDSSKYPQIYCLKVTFYWSIELFDPGYFLTSVQRQSLLSITPATLSSSPLDIITTSLGRK